MRARIVCLCLASLAVSAAIVTAQPTREITYNTRSVARLDTRLRMTTLVVLPEDEDILDFVCGDKDYWVISGAQNLAYIKPAKAGAATNLNLVTASGRVYSFLLAEGSPDPDLKVFVIRDPKDPQVDKRPAHALSSPDVEALRRDLADAKAEAARVKRDADDATHASERAANERIDQFKASYPLQLHFPYMFAARTKPFHVAAIFHDDRFTYIRLDARELPAVYEVVDHAPNLVAFQADHNTLIVPKILEHGYLALGKQRLTFDLVEK